MQLNNREFTTLPLTALTISRFNTRKERSEQKIRELANRIKRNGFEMTRALWVYSENGQYEVFAGGTRLEAARLAGLKEVPCLVYSSFELAEISRLADEDNENDEYHEPVNVVDIWAEYHRLSKEEGWTQKGKIAEVKRNKTKSVVNRTNQVFIQLPETE